MLAVVSIVAPDLAMFIGPCPLLGLFIVVPVTLPVIVLPVIVVVPVVIAPIVRSLDRLHLIVGLESTRGVAALL